MSIQINIDKNGTTTLATAGKYCDRNIDVVVAVDGVIIEPSEKIENHRWDYDTSTHIPQENCDFFWFNIPKMVGSRVRVRAIVPDNSAVLVNDYSNGIYEEYRYAEGEGASKVDEEYLITGEHFELGISCVRTEGFPRVIVTPKVSHTACFDGSIEGEYIDNELTTLRFGAFAECANLTKISLPNCTEMTGSRHFYHCTSLEVLELPEVDTASELSYTFTGDVKLERVSFQKLATTGGTGACFDGCTNLKRVDFTLLSGVNIGNYAFRNCTSLETIVIGGEILCPLNSGNVFSGASTIWSLYVPDNLVADYQKATNWVNYASRIKPMSELPEE